MALTRRLLRSSALDRCFLGSPSRANGWPRESGVQVLSVVWQWIKSRPSVWLGAIAVTLFSVAWALKSRNASSADRIPRPSRTKADDAEAQAADLNAPVSAAIERADAAEAKASETEKPPTPAQTQQDLTDWLTSRGL